MPLKDSVTLEIKKDSSKEQKPTTSLNKNEDENMDEGKAAASTELATNLNFILFYSRSL